MNDYEMRDNSGSLFAAKEETIIRQGPVKINGHETEAMIINVRYTARDGTPAERNKLALVIGDVKPNKQKRKDDDYDSYSEININGSRYMMWARKKVSAKGTEYTSLSFAEPKSQGNF